LIEEWANDFKFVNSLSSHSFVHK